MKLEQYELKAEQDLTIFRFLSKGPKGQITKLVQFQLMNSPGFYNLAFGDQNQLTEELDDKVITDNGDSEKVLATVVAAVYAFAGQYPWAWIYATGSTAVRTRLYRMGINKYFDTVEEDFDITGEYQGYWERYIKGKDYRAFAVHRKSSKFI